MRIFPAFSALLVLICTPPSIAQSSHLQAGATLFRNGDYARALQEFKLAESKQPHNASIKNLLGITETKLGHVEEANAFYRDAITDNPKLLAPYKNLAVNDLAANRFDEAKALLETGLTLNATDPFVHYYLASLYLATSNDRAAVNEIEPAMSLLGDDPALLYSMAMACLRLHLDEKALSLIRQAEQRQPLDVGQEYQLALLLTQNGRYPEATERFRDILKQQPGSWGARVDLAIALLHSNGQHEAVALLESLARERPSDANILALLGSARELSGDQEKSLEAYRAAVAADPGNPDRYLDYARLLMDLDRYGEASGVVQQGLAHVSDSYALDLRRGSILVLQGHVDEARAAFRAAIAAQPTIGLGYFALAQSFMREGNNQQAAAILHEALSKAVPDAKLEYLNGIVLSQLGQQDAASQAFTRSIVLDPGAAEPHYERGKLLLAAGHLEPARAEFEQAIALSPTHANAYFQLSKIYRKLGDDSRALTMANKTQELLIRERTGALQHHDAMLQGLQGAPPQ